MNEKTPIHQEPIKRGNLLQKLTETTTVSRIMDGIDALGFKHDRFIKTSEGSKRREMDYERLPDETLSAKLRLEVTFYPHGCNLTMVSVPWSRIYNFATQSPIKTEEVIQVVEEYLANVRRWEKC